MSEAIWLVSGLTKRHALTPGHLPILGASSDPDLPTAGGHSNVYDVSELVGRLQEMAADLLR